MSKTRKIFENFPTKDWYDLSLRKEEYSHYIDTSIEHQIEMVQGELSELLEGVKKQDFENISEEVGDVIFTTMSLLQSLLKKGRYDEVDLFVSGLAQKHKIYKRQPGLKNHRKFDTFDEEHNNFIKLKNKEKGENL